MQEVKNTIINCDSYDYNYDYKPLTGKRKLDEDIVWKWVLDTFKGLLNKTSGSLTEDEKKEISQESCLLIMNHYKDKSFEYVKKIYETQNIAILCGILRKKIFRAEAEYYFETRNDFSRYKKVHDVCQTYGIEEKPDNAYMIYHVLENPSPELNIIVIAQLLRKKKPKLVSYEQHFEGWGAEKAAKM